MSYGQITSTLRKELGMEPRGWGLAECAWGVGSILIAINWFFNLLYYYGGHPCATAHLWRWEDNLGVTSCLAPYFWGRLPCVFCAAYPGVPGLQTAWSAFSISVSCLAGVTDIDYICQFQVSNSSHLAFIVNAFLPCEPAHWRSKNFEKKKKKLAQNLRTVTIKYRIKSS